MKKSRYAFSMLELIFVIVIMGILGKYGVEFLARAYDNFIFSKINNDLQAKSASSVEFISKRLENRIKRSTRTFNAAGVWSYLDSSISDNTATTLEWISADIDSFRGVSQPWWSGVIDLTSSTTTSLVSPGSNFNSVNTAISTLSPSGASLSDAVIYFLDSALVAEYVGATLDTRGFYTNLTGTPTQAHTLHPIQAGGSSNTLTPVPSFQTGDTIHEYYKLAWTGNAVRLENYNATTNMGDLYFYYDYQPWQGEAFTTGQRVLLAEGISAFRFRTAGTLIKIQVCAKSNLTERYALCKEKTVF